MDEKVCDGDIPEWQHKPHPVVLWRLNENSTAAANLHLHALNYKRGISECKVTTLKLADSF